MVYVQTNLYQFISLSDDPVFNRIKDLNIGQETQIDSFKVRKTERFYEIENEDVHEVFNSLDKCYSFVSSNL